jgi:hypothetical protein
MTAELFLPSLRHPRRRRLVAFVLGSLLLFETPDSTIAVDRSPHRRRGVTERPSS